jgi:hypothetical protein
MARDTEFGKQWDAYDWRPAGEIWGVGTDLNVPGGAEATVLSIDHETGAMTALLRCPPGWRTPAPEYHSVDQEDILVEGDTTMGDRKLTAPAYMFFPAGQVHGPAVTENGCTMIVTLSGPFDITYPA